MRGELDDEYTDFLCKYYEGSVLGGADLVVYWFEKACAHIETDKCYRAGLVATQSVRKGANQNVLVRVCGAARIFNARSDQDWINEGAAVRVSVGVLWFPLPTGEDGGCCAGRQGR
ncbi:hypothetical protein NTGBS_350028 [Candidatus Nitrotoga sp. BS]|nr:hypothetical protein NTGBS_350028 [Candidatus Nitrotoga sp. BS]